MNNRNSYSSADTTVEATTATSPIRSPLRSVRVLFYIHLAVVCWFAVFSLSDTGLIKVPEIVTALFNFRPVHIPLFTWMACPVLMTIAAWKLHDRSTAFRVGIVLGDALLSAFQLWVMLPLIQ